MAGDARGVPAEGEEDREALAGIHVRGADGVGFCGAAGGARRGRPVGGGREGGAVAGRPDSCGNRSLMTSFSGMI